tara:strand:+ start:136 stop:309 length:174 start_codon:yes stop_codon:yes gene_type:complete
MKKRNYYPQGYLGKIAYHAAQGNVDGIAYFTGKQIKSYGPLTKEDVDIIQRLKLNLV